MLSCSRNFSYSQVLASLCSYFPSSARIHGAIDSLPKHVHNQLTQPYVTDPFAEADEDTGETKQSQNYIHIRIQRASLPLQSYTCLNKALSVPRA